MAPFRETFLAQLTDRNLRNGLRAFGRLLAFLATEATSAPAAGWCAGHSSSRRSAGRGAQLARRIAELAGGSHLWRLCL